MQPNVKNWSLWIASTLAMIILFQLSYGLQCLLPSNINWLMTVRHDWGTHYLGWAFYKNEPWHFPLGKVTGYNYPVGTNVGFTDSIPLFAIFFKLFAPLLGEDFQYFGIFLFLCHVLTAWFTILLFRLFKINRVITLAAVIFIGFNPVLIYRGMHPALCAQWLLVASIYVYFLNPLQVPVRRILRYQFILLMLSALINPYLCWMVLGFTFILPLRICFFDKAMNKKMFFSYLAISLFSMVLLWYLVGFVEFGKKEDLGVTGAFGLYSMNLNSLFNPSGYGSMLPQLKQVSWHQYEGFMYLGVGMMVLIAGLMVYYTFIFLRKTNPKIQSTESTAGKKPSLIPLFLLIIAYTILSLALVFTWNEKELFRIPAPSFFIKLEEIFRACARFFWTPYYLILLFTIIGIAKTRLKQVITSVFILLALVIQLYDIHRLITSKEMSYGTYQPPMDNRDWIRLMEAFDEILFFPAFDSPKLRHMDYQDFSYLALKAHRPVNLAYVARSDAHQMQVFADSLTSIIQSGTLPPKALYITDAGHLEYFSKVFQMKHARLNTLDGCYYIFSNEVQNKNLDTLVSRLNAANQMKLDSALQVISNRKEFTAVESMLTGDQNPIHYNIESKSVSQDMISMSGWAFIDSTQNNEKDSIFISLTSSAKSYWAPAITSPRSDMNAAFNKVNITNSGFKFLAFTDSVQAGNYKVGMVIKDGRGRLIYQDLHLETDVKVPVYALPEKISQLPTTGKMMYDLLVTDAATEFSAGGWAALENRGAEGCVIRLVLKSDSNMYDVPTKISLRPDVTASFNHTLKLDSAGYGVKLLKSDFQKGKYQLGILITETATNIKTVMFTDKTVNIR